MSQSITLKINDGTPSNNTPTCVIEQIRLVGNEVIGKTDPLEQGLTPIYGIEVHDNEYINE